MIKVNAWISYRVGGTQESMTGLIEFEVICFEESMKQLFATKSWKRLAKERIIVSSLTLVLSREFDIENLNYQYGNKKESSEEVCKKESPQSGS